MHRKNRSIALIGFRSSTQATRYQEGGSDGDQVDSGDLREGECGRGSGEEVGGRVLEELHSSLAPSSVSWRQVCWSLRCLLAGRGMVMVDGVCSIAMHYSAFLQ